MGLENVISSVGDDNKYSFKSKENPNSLDRKIKELFSSTLPYINFFSSEFDIDGYYKYYLSEFRKLDYTLGDIEKFINESVKKEYDDKDYPSFYGYDLLGDNVFLSKKIGKGIFLERHLNLESDFMGLIVSAAINRVAKDGDKLKIMTDFPLNYLMFRSDKKLNVDIKIAGDYLGAYSRNVNYNVKEAGDWAFYNAEKIEATADYLIDFSFVDTKYINAHIKSAGNAFAAGSTYSEFSAELLKDHAFENATWVKAHVNRAYDYFGLMTENSNYDCGLLEDNAFYKSCNTHVKVKNFGKKFGKYSKNINLENTESLN